MHRKQTTQHKMKVLNIPAYESRHSSLYEKWEIV